MAQTHPNSELIGFDNQRPPIGRERNAAGHNVRVRFEQAADKEFPGKEYDSVAVFDCLHDIGDPVGAARHVRESLKPDRTWMIVQPFANNKFEDKLIPVGRILTSTSTRIGTPASRAQKGGTCRCAQAGECNLREVVKQGGFSKFRRATETPFNLIFEARP